VKSCVAVRHVAFEDLDRLEPVLVSRGFAVTEIDAATGDLSALDPLAPDLLVVLGGPIGVGDLADYPFLAAEIRLLERRLAADRPTLGICLGAQLMARALGGRVFANPNGKEIGWAPLSLNEAGADSALGDLAAAAVLHWHGDTFDLPHGAIRLASTPQTENQAFAWGLRGLALQFHIEAGQRGLERWFVGHAAEIAATPGVSVAGLRRDTARHAPRMEAVGARVLGRWLDQVCG
jgi:GMP synthase (glutamine-hydrolysing)